MVGSADLRRFTGLSSQFLSWSKIFLGMCQNLPIFAVCTVKLSQIVFIILESIFHPDAETQPKKSHHIMFLPADRTLCSQKRTLPKNDPRYKDFEWVGSPQPRWVWKNCLLWNGENQLPHWNNQCLMECCQRLHPQLVVFKEQRSSPLCEMLAVEICEMLAATYFNAEAPALKRQKERACQHHPMKWLQNPDETRIWPNSRARISHNSAYRNVRFAMAIKLQRKLHFLKITLFLGARFPVRRDVFAVEDMGISWYILNFYSLT